MDDLADRPAVTQDQIDALFRPRSIAILGASRTPTKFGHVLMKALIDHRYPGMLYPVNPAADEILGQRCYPGLDVLPEAPELALIALPVAQVLAAFEACASRGVRAVIIITSGFAEIGEEGLAVEAALAAASARSGVPIVGPNCQGIVDTSTPMYAVMAGAMYQDPVPSTAGVSIVSHSGGYTGYCFRACADQGVGVAKAISSGNEAVLGLVDYLRVLEEDDATKAILLHLEGITRADEFRAIASRVTRRKPIVINHVGRTPEAAVAATTHTAHLAVPGRVMDAYYRQCGAVVTGDQEAAIDAATILATMPPPRGNGVAVISFSGGMRVEFADLLAEAELPIPAFTADTERALAEFIPSHGSVQNPVDMADGLLVDPSCPGRSIRAVATDPSVDIVVVILTITKDPAVARGIVEAIRAIDKPVVVMCTAQQYSGPAMAVFRGDGIPVYSSTRRALNAVRALDQRRQVLDAAEDAAGDRIAPASAGGRGQPVSLASAEAFAALAAEGIDSTPWRTFDPDVAIGEAGLAGLRFPLVVKFDSADLPHKTEAGAVVLGCDTAAKVDAARREVVDAARRAQSGIVGTVLVQEMAHGVGEVMLGLQRDPVIGPIVILGTGGILVELFDDVAVRALPASPASLAAMLGELKGIRALQGFRGRPAGDLDALLTLVGKAAEFFVSRPDLVSMDMNPIIVGVGGVSVVDVLMQSSAAPPASPAEIA